LTRIASDALDAAATCAVNLSALYLTTGDLSRAIKFAQRSVELADRVGSEFPRLGNRAMLANALHQAGRLAEASATFREAENMQKRHQPEYPVLYSMQGFRYCDLLLGQGQIREVKDRASRTLEWARQQGWPLDTALDNLSLGRAWLLEAEQHGTGDTRQAAEFLQRAVDGLRLACAMELVAVGLLACAELRRVRCDYAKAERDLVEAMRIATRGGMDLYVADCQLESARLQLAQGNRGQAGEHWETAKAMIERMGYHRRDKEVDELAQKLH
jgi:tetratricopeptide (TPR) repeat protein